MVERGMICLQFIKRECWEHTAHQSRRYSMANNIRWGLDNRHPFSQMKTELIREEVNSIEAQQKKA